jgi:hypothetical protein
MIHFSCSFIAIRACLSGGLISETYPSGRVVHHEIDTDGDLARVWGQRGTSISTYANAFS